MTAEHLPPSVPETRNIGTPDGFIEQLFEDTKIMLELGKNARIAAEIPLQFIKKWGNPASPSLQINRGLILRSERHDFGLVLGDRGKTAYDKTRPTLEFGLLSYRGINFEDTVNRFNLYGKDKNRDEKVLYYLNAIVNQTKGGTYGSAGFYTDRGTIEVDCWVDERAFGGSGVGNWEYGRILSEAGLDASLGIIRELTNRARY